MGLLAVRKMVDLLGGGCGLTVSHIAPLRHDAHENLKVPASGLPRDASREERREATRRLRSHFRRMGFERIGRTPYYGLSMAHVTPTMADLIRPAT